MMKSKNWEELLGPGVRKKVVVDGHGEYPELGSLVVYNWKGNVLLDDGTSGASFSERAQATARIGDGEDIPGVELGLRHMRVGEQCIVRCESRFAYGPDGCPATRSGDSDLPPNSNIEVRIELLAVPSKKPVSDMTPEETVVEGRRKKMIGNAYFERAAFKQALRAYTSAANCIARLELSQDSGETCRGARQLRIECGNNIAMTCVRLGDLEKAKEAAVSVLELDPVNVKALFRAGQVSSLQSNFIEARLALQKAQHLNPDSKEIQSELGRLSARIKSYKTKRQAVQEKMAKNLFLGFKSEGDCGGVGASVGGREENQAVDGACEQATEEDTSNESDSVKPAVSFSLERCRAVVAYVMVALIAWGFAHNLDIALVSNR